MSLESAIIDHIEAAATVVALTSTRIYPAPLPEEATLPAISYEIISNVPRRGHNGETPKKLAFALVQLNIWATTKASAVAVRDAARDDFADGGGGTYDSTNLQSVNIDAMRSDYEPTARRYREMIDLAVWYSEV